MIVQNIVVKLIGSSCNSNYNIVLFQLTWKFICSNQVKIIIMRILDNWNSNLILFDYLFDLIINSIVFSSFEFDWSSLEKLITLSLDFFIGESSFL